MPDATEGIVELGVATLLYIGMCPMEYNLSSVFLLELGTMVEVGLW